MVFAKRGRDRDRVAVFENKNTIAQQEARLFGSTTRAGEWLNRRKNSSETHRRKSDADVSPGRYLCGGVRSLYAVLLFHLRRRERAARKREAQGDDSRRRTKSDRPGNRVRLLLRARRVRAARARLRNDHGELEPGNGFDRLRHERQTVFRTAHTRGCAQYLRSRKAGRRHCSVRRTNTTQSRRWIESGRRPDSRHTTGEHRNR